MSERPLNRIKVVLFENKKTSKWLAEQLGVSVVTVISGVPTCASLTCRCWPK